MISHRLEVTVIGGSLLLAMYGALRAVRVQDYSPVPCSSHSMAHPFSVQLLQTSQVILGNKDFGFKPAQGIGAGRLLL